MKSKRRLKNKQPSIKRQLLIWIIVPMLLMIVVDTSILYRVARHFIQKSYDYELSDTANEIATLIKSSTGPIKDFKLSVEAHKVILSDNLDQVYYSVYDEKHNYVAGNNILPLMIAKSNLPEGKVYSNIFINKNQFRVVTIESNFIIGNDHNKLFIQVAETINKRNRLSHQILIGIMLPQLILLFAAGTLIHFAINRGLKPLQELDDAIIKRSHRELSPIKLNKVPNEVNGIIKSINLLMSQIKSVIELQNRFVADAAHQLKTPLAGIQAHLELIELEKNEQERQSSYAKVSLSVKKLTHMVSQLLKLSQNQPESQNTLDMKVINLVALSKECCTEMVPTAYIKNIDLGFEVIHENETETDFNILGDANKLKVMLQNLIDNAIRYTLTGGKVTVCTEVKPGKILLSVEDNGIGIPKNQRQRVFERFHRVIDNRQEGSGLGLSIVREIVQLHKAEIAIEFGKGGVGTKVAIIFPIRV